MKELLPQLLSYLALLTLMFVGISLLIWVGIWVWGPIFYDCQ